MIQFLILIVIFLIAIDNYANFDHFLLMVYMNIFILMYYKLRFLFIFIVLMVTYL